MLTILLPRGKKERESGEQINCKMTKLSEKQTQKCNVEASRIRRTSQEGKENELFT